MTKEKLAQKIRFELQLAAKMRRLGKVAEKSGVRINRLSEIIHEKRRLTDHYMSKLLYLIK